jgi:hypothetical protein
MIESSRIEGGAEAGSFVRIIRKHENVKNPQVLLKVVHRI